MEFLGIRLIIETILILGDNYQIIIDQHNFSSFALCTTLLGCFLESPKVPILKECHFGKMKL